MKGLKSSVVPLPGSVYQDASLQESGFVGQEVESGAVLVFKSHEIGTCGKVHVFKLL